jgi:tetratricopeptide (TPR) repeat protein
MGAIVRDTATGRWQATAQVEQVTIPDTIQGVIIARVDRLEGDVKRVLKMAAVIGRSFLYRVLRAIAEADRALDQRLVELQQVELIREKRRVPEMEYIFKHALAQEAVYESILLGRRRSLHAQVGACIETLFADRLEEFYGLLAYHYARAEAWEKAQEYLFKVGDQAGQVAADAEALAHYRRALTAYTRAFGDRWDPFQRAVLERKMGEALFRQGNHQQAIEYLQRALAYLGSPFPTSRWGVRLAVAREFVQQIGHRLLPGLSPKSKVGQVDPAVKEWINIYEVMGWMDFFMDQERFLLDSIKVLNVAERSGFPFGTLRGSAGVGIICDAIGMFCLAEHYHRQAVALAEQIQHPAGIGVAYLGMGLHELYLGQWGETNVIHLRRAAEAYWEMGDLREWGLITSLLRQLFLWRGDFVHSLELCQELIRIGRDGSDPQLWAWGLQGSGAVWQRTGSLGEAMACLQKAIELYKAIPNYMEQADASGELGLCYLRQGSLKKALAVLEEANQLIAAHGLKGYMVNPSRNVLAEVYLVEAERAKEPERAAWMRKAKRICRAALKESKTFRGGLPYAMRLQGRYEWLRGRPKAARKWWQRSVALAEELGARYDLGMVCLEMGQRLGERVRLEQAEAIFVEIGAELDLARARELLGGER